jgi:glutamyl-tRNA reductase
VEAGVAELENVYLYNLDDLQQVVSRTQAQRKDAIAAAQTIVASHVQEFIAWQRQRELGPAIHRLYSRYHQIAQEELGKTMHKLPNLSAAERAHLEDLARRIVNKLLHDPVHALRSSDGLHLPATQYLHALEKLFQLGQEDAQNQPGPPSQPQAGDEPERGPGS